MNRRQWLRNAALIAAGTVAADQIDLLERLTWRRTLFPGAQFTLPPGTYTFDIETFSRGDNFVRVQGVIRPDGKIIRVGEVEVPYTIKNVMNRSRPLQKLLEPIPLPNNQRFDLDYLRSKKLIVKLEKEEL